MIARIIPESSIDYKGHFGPLILTKGCNFKCGFCHNAALNNVRDDVDEDKVIRDLEAKSHLGWYNGVTVSGGEPTLHPELAGFLKKLKKLGLDVKLDTNGSNPVVLQKLLDDEVVDYVAMDIKGPKELYSKIVNCSADIEKIEESIKILSNLAPEKYEFRTTIPIVDGKFLSTQEAEKMAKWVDEFNQGEGFWYLQPFISRNKEDMNDPEMADDKLSREMLETSKETLAELKEVVGKYFKKCEIR